MYITSEEHQKPPRCYAKGSNMLVRGFGGIGGMYVAPWTGQSRAPMSTAGSTTTQLTVAISAQTVEDHAANLLTLASRIVPLCMYT